eukprot:Amastigsp_a183_1367.p4 type:complete len:100 gc:universal Amastigsp_a183_1367:331-32(-)
MGGLPPAPRPHPPAHFGRPPLRSPPGRVLGPWRVCARASERQADHRDSGRKAGAHEPDGGRGRRRPGRGPRRDAEDHGQAGRCPRSPWLSPRQAVTLRQ